MAPGSYRSMVPFSQNIGADGWRRLRQSPRFGPLVVSLCFAAVAGIVRLRLPLMTDHGLMVADAGLQIFHHGPVALFFQFLRPTAGLVSLPGVLLGWNAFFAIHILLGSAAVYMIGRAASELYDRGWPAALILAASPEFLFRTVTGVSNAIAVFLFVLVLYLLIARRSPFWAGLVMGALVWCRFEYGAYALVMIAFHLRSTGGWKLLAGAAVFPLLYLGGGAIYHGSVIWFLRFPPDPGMFSGARELDDIGPTIFNAAVVLAGLALVSPLWPLIALRRWSSLSLAEKAVLASLGVAFMALLAIPLSNLLHVPLRTRYWLMLLPNLALLIGGVRLDSLTRPRLMASLLGGSAIASVVVVLATTTRHWVGMLPLFAATALVLMGLGSSRVRDVSFALISAALMISLLMTARHNDLETNFVSANTIAVARWIDGLPPEEAPKEILTNVHLLNYVLQRQRGRGMEPEVRFILQGDIGFTICRLSNHDNGQYEGMVRAFRNDSLLGRATWGCELPFMNFDETLFVLRDDYRLQSSILQTSWDSSAELLESFGEVKVWRLRPGSVLGEAKSDFPFDRHCRSICPGE